MTNMIQHKKKEEEAISMPEVIFASIFFGVYFLCISEARSCLSNVMNELHFHFLSNCWKAQ